MNLRLLFTLPPNPPKQSDEERHKETAQTIMRGMAVRGFLTAEEIEDRFTTK